MHGFAQLYCVLLPLSLQGFGSLFAARVALYYYFLSCFRFEDDQKNLELLFQIDNDNENRVWILIFPSYPLNFLFLFCLLRKFRCHLETCAKLKLVTCFQLLWGQSPVCSFERDRFSISSPVAIQTQKQKLFRLAFGSSSTVSNVFPNLVNSRPSLICCRSCSRGLRAAPLAPVQAPGALAETGRAPPLFGSQMSDPVG